ncbi:hypothetical protein GCM10017744_078470 [Streptomyces antimycoticus]|uniref:Uncharacterized protein n=1 Tax=Streptomyces antimycoticus TaxID=68175 RepID=A0A4D4JX59_9ACTN|nr:hypothetical protein SANT12839_022930 [Streptomyces antimycoticus]
MTGATRRQSARALNASIPDTRDTDLETTQTALAGADEVGAPCSTCTATISVFGKAAGPEWRWTPAPSHSPRIWRNHRSLCWTWAENKNAGIGSGPGWRETHA